MMTPHPSHHGFRLTPFSPLRRQQVDWLELERRQHTIHALLEVDVTETRRTLKAYRALVQQRISLTAFAIHCVARAVADEPQLHAYRQGARRLVLFDDVDVMTPVEHTVNGCKLPLPHIIRAANRRDLAAIQRELREAVQGGPSRAVAPGWMNWWVLVPAWLRRRVWTALLASPHRRKRYTGTVVVTALSMFGSGTAWGVPLNGYTLCVTLGGLARKPGLCGPGEQIGIREYLGLTLSVDHDVVDGAPLARFATRLKRLLERGVGLPPSGNDADPAPISS